jgi:hypothetical protein
MNKDSSLKKDMESVTKTSLPLIISRAIINLEEAKTYSEKLEAIDKAKLTFDALDKAKKYSEGLEFELENAKAEIIIAVDRAKVDILQRHERGVKDGIILGDGQTKKTGTSGKSKLPEARVASEIPKTQAEAGIVSNQRLSEIRKVVNFDKNNPGVREQIIRDMPNKGEPITKGISLKIAEKEDKPQQKQVIKLEIIQTGVNSKEQIKILEDKAIPHIVQLTQIMRQIYEKLKIDNNIMPDYIFTGKLGILQRIISKFIELYPIDVVLSKGAWGEKTGAFEGDYTIIDENKD